MSYLVANPEDRFSRDVAQFASIQLKRWTCLICYSLNCPDVDEKWTATYHVHGWRHFETSFGIKLGNAGVFSVSINQLINAWKTSDIVSALWHVSLTLNKERTHYHLSADDNFGLLFGRIIKLPLQCQCSITLSRKWTEKYMRCFIIFASAIIAYTGYRLDIKMIWGLRSFIVAPSRDLFIVFLVNNNWANSWD